MFLSKDKGDTWTPINKGVTNTNINSLVINGTNIFAGTEDGVFLSTDSGSNWTATSLTLDIQSIVIIGKNIFAGTFGGGVFLSSDTGGSWKAINIGINGTSGLIFILSMVTMDTSVFVGTLNGLYVSTNYGNNWTEVDSGLIEKRIRSLTASASNIFSGSDDGVFLSSDKGKNWKKVSTGLKVTEVHSLLISGTNIFAATWGGGIFLSSDNGDNWFEVNAGLKEKHVRRLATDGTNIFAGTFWDGVWKRPIIEMTTGIIELSSDNLDFSIYPNPSQGKFTMTCSCNINSVVIHNLLGEEIYSIPNFKEYISNEIDIPHVNEGIYFVTIYDDKRNFTKKIMINRN